MKPKRRFICLFFLTLAMSVLMAVPAFAVSIFTDVPLGSTYYGGVSYLAENGITAGTGNNCYSPDNPVTVRQLAVFLCRAVNEDELFSDEEGSFEDLCVRQGFKDGWLTMEDASQPDTPMCRGAVLLTTLRALGYEIYDYTLYPDGEFLSGWENALRIGKEYGLCSESDTAAEILTRGEVANLLQALLTQQYEVIQPPVLNAISIRNNSEVALNDYLLQISRVPLSVRNAFSEDGWEYIIDYEYMKEFSEERGMNCIGATSYAEEKITVSAHRATVHEFGHFLDDVLGFPAKHKELYQSEAQKAQSVLGKYSTTDPLEYFAEYFQYWIDFRTDARKMSQLQSVSPLTYEYFTVLEANNWCVENVHSASN